MSILNGIFHRLKKEIDFTQEQRWVLGFSGGPDSVFLLEALLEFKKREDIELEIVLVHINHLLRGENSDGDENFSRETAKKHNLKIYVKRAEIEKMSQEKKIGLEEAGREIRHNFFHETLGKENCSRILLAHNKDDQIETFLFRLMRGTSLEGLEGIAFSRDEYLRPINHIYKSEIMDYLDKNTIEYRVDESNLESDFTRNSIRLELIPFIEKKYNPKFKDKIYNLIGEIGEANSELKTEYREYLLDEDVMNISRNKSSIEKISLEKISLEKIKKISNYRAKKVINSYLNNMGISSDRYKLEKIVQLMNQGGTKKITLSQDVFLVKDYTNIYVEKDEKRENLSEIKLTVPGKIIFGNYEIEAKICTTYEKKDKNNDTILTNFKKDDTLVIRQRKTGDRIIPKGMLNQKKIKDILIDEKIPKDMRDTLPICSFKEEIFWVAGIKFSEKYLKKKDDTQWTELVVRRI